MSTLLKGFIYVLISSCFVLPAYAAQNVQVPKRILRINAQASRGSGVLTGELKQYENECVLNGEFSPTTGTDVKLISMKKLFLILYDGKQKVDSVYIPLKIQSGDVFIIDDVHFIPCCPFTKIGWKANFIVKRN